MTASDLVLVIIDPGCQLILEKENLVYYSAVIAFNPKASSGWVSCESQMVLLPLIMH